MSLSAQSKVLRAIQENKIQKVGSDKDIYVDTRVIAATNKNITELIKSNKFREDLYHRISVIELNVPPLNDRKPDIPLLIDYFIQQLTDQYDGRHLFIDETGIKKMTSYDWKGNVRELRNIVERLFILSESDQISEKEVVKYSGKNNEKIINHIYLFAQFLYTQDDIVIKNIFNTSLTKSKAYSWLDYLSNQIGGRLSGSLEAERAVEWGKVELEKLNFDKVWLQPVMVPRWVRGPKEFALIETEPGITFNVPIAALGGSVSTPSVGLKAEVIEVFSLKELEELGKEKIDGKIVFFNRPMEPEFIQTFTAYGRAVDQRALGALEASKYGAIGVIVRSMNLRLDDHPHTGGLTYGDLTDSKKIPAAAISTNGAEKLSSLLKIKPKLKFLFRQQCKQMSDVLSYNVIAEKKGTTFPDEIILVAGHLDSWDTGDGSHDDLQVLFILWI